MISQHYGLSRETADLDVIPGSMARRVVELAGRGAALQKKHKVYIDHVAIVNHPAGYEDRLVRAFPLWPKVRLWALGRMTWR